MKKLLSFLGTGNYSECQYEFGETATASRFVQTAIYELFCRDFSSEDEVVIFLTPAAKEKNWVDSCKGDDPMIRLEGLESAFRRIAPGAQVRLVKISEEQDENGLWKLFDQVLKEIDEGDEIIFDITHSFRSFPVMAVAILNYSRLLKKATFRHIVYGAFELARRSKEEASPDSPKIAPIIELTPMVKLMDWSIGIDHFLRSGDASLIQEMTEMQKREIYQRTRHPAGKGGDAGTHHDREAATKYRNLAQQLDNFTKSLQTCRGPLLLDTAKALNEKLKAAEAYDALPLRPLGRLLDEVERRLQCFSGNPVMLGYEAAQWCLDHGLIQQGFTFLQEGLFTAVCHVLGKNEMDRSVRSLISSAFAIVEQKTPEAKWRVSGNEMSELKQCVTFLQPYRERIHWYSTLQEYRNNINHAGYNQPTPPQRFAKTLGELLEKSRPFFEELSRLAAQPLETHQRSDDSDRAVPDESPKMFLLLSHALTDEQVKEAEERFGVTTFCPLPEPLQTVWSHIPVQGEWQPSWVEPIQNWLLQQGKPGDLVVVQGEFGVTVYMVAWLRQHRFRPMYATSKRQVEETPLDDGSVVTTRKFCHVQFRDYP